jgi:two-component system, OmpR family, response regulator
MRILIVEDDSQIAGYLEKGLAEAGFAVDAMADGIEAYQMALTTDYDALVVDVMLPGIDGIELIRRLRAKAIQAPVLILSARGSLDDKLEGFKAGTDDYLTKPFSFAELLMRLNALIRRSSGSSQSMILSAGDLEMDLLSRSVRRGDVEIELQPREYSLLEYLMRNAGNVVTKTMILEHVWDYHFDPQTNVVDVLVHRLRSKIDRDFDLKLIHTIRGVGYVLKVS